MNIRDAIAKFQVAMTRIGAPIVRGSPEALAGLSERLGVAIPEEVEQFYLSIDGTPSTATELPEHIRVWPTAEISPLTSELPNYARLAAGGSDLFVFADYLFWSMAYCIRMTSIKLRTSPVWLVGEGQPEVVAESFGAFVGAYSTAPGSLLPR